MDRRLRRAERLPRVPRHRYVQHRGPAVERRWPDIRRRLWRGHRPTDPSRRGWGTADEHGEHPRHDPCRSERLPEQGQPLPDLRRAGQCERKSPRRAGAFGLRRSVHGREVRLVRLHLHGPQDRDDPVEHRADFSCARGRQVLEPLRSVVGQLGDLLHVLDRPRDDLGVAHPGEPGEHGRQGERLPMDRR